MRRLGVFLLALTLSLPLCGFWQSRDSNYNVSISGGGGGCTEATNYLARTSGSPNTAAITTMICGLVTDGVWSKFDVFYIRMIDSASNGVLNAVSSSFASTNHGATFTANLGFTGDGATTYLDATGFVFSSATNCTQNSCALFAWSNTNSASNGYILGNSGAFDSSTGLQVLTFGSNTSGFVNTAGAGTSGAPADGLGLFTASRTTSSNVSVYRNATALTNSTTDTSQARSGNSYQVLRSGSLGFWAGAVCFDGVASGLTATDVSNLYARLHAYAQTVGGLP